MEILPFTLGVTALLAVPGPTNTLLAASGALVGVRRSLALIPTGGIAYGLVISLLTTVAGPVITVYPSIAVLVKVLAALWLAYSARSLWRHAGVGFGDMAQPISLRPISLGRMFTTTALNPKGLVFAMVLFPHGSIVSILPFLALFSGLDAIVAMGWVCLGALLARRAERFITPARWSKAAAVALSVFAVVLAGTALAAAL